MPCYQLNVQPPGFYKIGQGGFATEADCLNACKEGACCESNGTCNVRPQCQCQGAGQTFQGIGTVCSPNPCPTPITVCTECCAAGFLSSSATRTLVVNANLAFSTSCGGTNYTATINQNVSLTNNGLGGVFGGPCDFTAAVFFAGTVCQLQLALQIRVANGACDVTANLIAGIRSSAGHWSLCDGNFLGCGDFFLPGLFVQYGDVATQSFSSPAGCMSGLSIPINGSTFVGSNANAISVSGTLTVQQNPLP